MKYFLLLLFVMFIAGCKLRPDNSAINTAAIHFSSVFIKKYITSIENLKVKTADAKSDSGNIYHVTGMVEGYSSYNVPFSVDHFSETLHYSGGNPNDSASWECIEIYVGKKKIK